MNPIHGDTFPMSFAQQRMWLLDRMLPAQGIYNTGQVVRLAGALDVDALERALAALVQRHESLRTTFVVPEPGAFGACVVALLFSDAACGVRRRRASDTRRKRRR